MPIADFVWPLHRPPIDYPHAPYPALFAAGVARGPDRMAIVFHAQRITYRELLGFIAGRVAGYKKIRVLEFIDAIPKNPSGKIRRRVLKKRTRGGSP